MTTVGWGEILDGMEIRRAIIRSAIERGIQEIRSDPQRGVRTDTQAYRQFGNSVTVPVIRSVAKLMMGACQDGLRGA